MKPIQSAAIFFLPLSDRPNFGDPLKKLKGRFWHTGIIYQNKVYECFNHGKWRISPDKKRRQDPEFSHATIISTRINPKKIKSEITSGTDCAEFVARCTGLSDLTGPEKGKLWPADIFNLLIKNNE